MDKQKQIDNWKRRARDAQTAVSHFLLTLEQWERQEIVTDSEFMHEVGLLDEGGLLMGFDNPWLDDLRYTLTGTE